MPARSVLLCTIALATLFAMGCQGPAQRLNAPPQGASDRPHPLQDDMNYMVDNAMLHDMAVSDIHFVPHVAQVSSVGARRLLRYAELLAVYGGTIHYTTAETDEDLIEARVDKLKEFLAQAGLDMEEVSIELGPPRGRGILATDAIRYRQQSTVGSGFSASTGGGAPTP